MTFVRNGGFPIRFGLMQLYCPRFAAVGIWILSIFHLAMFHLALLNGSEVAPFGYYCRISQDRCISGFSLIQHGDSFKITRSLKQLLRHNILFLTHSRSEAHNGRPVDIYTGGLSCPKYGELARRKQAGREIPYSGFVATGVGIDRRSANR